MAPRTRRRTGSFGLDTYLRVPAETDRALLGLESQDVTSISDQPSGRLRARRGV